MACFMVSAATAAVVEVAGRYELKKEKRTEEEGVQKLEGQPNRSVIPLSVKLRWLRNMLLGGVVLLLFEHIWHGEVTPWFPFLTAMSDSLDTAEMLHEMTTVGFGMVFAVFIVWIGVCVAVDSIVNRSNEGAAELR